MMPRPLPTKISAGQWAPTTTRDNAINTPKTTSATHNGRRCLKWRVMYMANAMVAAIVMAWPEGMALDPAAGVPMGLSKLGSNAPKGRGTPAQFFSKGDSSEPSKKLFNTTALVRGANCAATINSKKAAPPSPNWVRKDHRAAGPVSLAWTSNNQAWLQGELKTTKPTSTSKKESIQAALGVR